MLCEPREVPTHIHTHTYIYVTRIAITWEVNSLSTTLCPQRSSQQVHAKGPEESGRGEGGRTLRHEAGGKQAIGQADIWIVRWPSREKEEGVIDQQHSCERERRNRLWYLFG
jgi:hypothetical protein